MELTGAERSASRTDRCKDRAFGRYYRANNACGLGSILFYAALLTTTDFVRADSTWMFTGDSSGVRASAAGLARGSNRPTRGSYPYTTSRSKHSRAINIDVSAHRTFRRGAIVNQELATDLQQLATESIGGRRVANTNRDVVAPALKQLTPEQTKRLNREYRRKTQQWCYSLPGLVARQRKMCLERPKLVTAAITGTQMAIEECKRQFQFDRWNCSLIFNGLPGAAGASGRDGRRKSGSKGEYLAQGLRNATREGAFLHAIMSAGIAHAVTVACRSGELSACHCDKSVSKLDVVMEILQEIIQWEKGQSKGGRTHAAAAALKRIHSRDLLGASEFAKNRTRVWSARQSVSGRSWKEEVEQISWGGCSDDVTFGVRFSRRFVEAPYNDMPPRKRTARDDVILHNGEVGRRMVQALTKVHCRCHGMSGSCTAQTCWMQMASFQEVGDALKRKYTDSIQALDEGRPRRRLRHITDSGRMRRVPKTELAFINETPNLCREDRSLGIVGTAGRQCLKHADGPGNCRVLCCGRGYNTKQVQDSQRCQCKFKWCCEVQCEVCHEVKNVYTCKA